MPILKLYRTNRTTDPDVTVSSGASYKFLVTVKNQDGPPKTRLTVTPWPFARLELFTDENSKYPTFVVPTIANDTDGFLTVLDGPISELNFKCHMTLLNGDKAGESSTVGLFMRLYRPVVKGQNRTYLRSLGDNSDTGDGGIGDTGWTWLDTPDHPTGAPVGGAEWNNFPLSQINGTWFGRKRPIEQIRTRDNPGALLEMAFAKSALPEGSNSLPAGCSLQIQYVPQTVTVLPVLPVPATLAFVFRPGPSWNHSFPLPVDQPIPHFALPLPNYVPKGRNSRYRVVQRPSDDWLKGTLQSQADTTKPDPDHQEWSIAVDAVGDVQKTWNDAVTEYNRALRDVRSVNRVSLLPLLKDYKPDTASSLDLDGESFNFGADFLVRFRSSISGQPDPHPRPSGVMIGALVVTPLRVAPLGIISATLQFCLNVGDLVPTIDDGPMQVQSVFYQAALEPIERGNAIDGSFGFKAKLASQIIEVGTPPRVLPGSQQVRIGSLDLTFGGDPDMVANLFELVQVFQMIDLSSTSAVIPRFSSQMMLPLIAVTPGGQDGLPASEYAPENASASRKLAERCIERRFNGSAPVVIPVSAKPDDKQTPAFLLSAVETNQDAYSQTVALTLKNVGPQTTTAPSKPRVIVIDSDPFLVAAIDYQPLTGANNSNVVALWNTGAIEGAAWQLQTGDQPFTLTLPPQGIGEEMPKDINDGIPKSPPLGFRLSPPAPLALKASYFAQNFTEAPWNLRRILGYPGQRDAGAGVVSLNFELLYGLACTIDAPLLRLAEIFALVGRIPGRIASHTFVNPPTSVGPVLTKEQLDAINKAYERKRWDWSIAAELYSKRVALLEPRASGDNYGSTAGAAGASAAPEVFTLSDGVSCTFRSTADLYYSTDPQKLKGIDDDNFAIVSKGLKGGVTWPFESSRIFHATVRNPKSSSATASGLALSPLGGTGTVKAGFDKNLSTITATTEIGRTSKETVARLGRIGVFHNLARYVIEYERDTSVTRQFSDNHIEFNRIPVLRKVREFVEILEPVATLSNSSQTYPGAGCVRSIEFKQRFIPVTSAWSANVGDNGWKIPLWYKPDSVPADSIYKLPEVVFNFAGAEAADVECCILSVDKLFFYTETDAAADSDPHRWPLVSGVDFLPCPVPTPNAAFESNKPHEIPAYDPVTPFGLASFTHQIDKGHGRVNLVEGRSATAIGANLISVTLQRAPSQVSGLQTQLQAIHDTVRGDLFHAVRQDPSNVLSLSNQICTQAQNVEAKFNSQTSNLIQSLAASAVAKEQSLLQNWFQQLQQEILKATDEVYSYLNIEDVVIGKSIEGAKLQIRTAVKEKVATCVERMKGVPATANSLAQFFGRIAETLTLAKAGLEEKRAQIKDALKNASDRSNDLGVPIDQTIAQYVTLIRADLSGPVDQCNTLLDQVRTQVLARAETWMPGASLISHAWEKDIHGNLLKANAVLAQADILLSYANSRIDDQIVSAELALKKLIGDALSVVSNLNAFAFPSELTTVTTDATKLQDLLGTLPATVSTTIDKEADGYIDRAATQLQEAKTTILNAPILQSLINKIGQLIVNDAQTTVADTAQAAIAGTAATAGFAQKYIDLLTKFTLAQTGQLFPVGAEVCKAVDQLKSAALNQMEAYRRTLEDSLGRFAESVAHFLPPVDIKMPVGVSLPVLLNRAFGAVPDIPNLGFSLPSAAYFYLPSLPHVPLTPLLTQVKDLIPNLSPLSTMLPSFALSDRALPVPHLPNFDLNGILPDFAGLKLDNLFPALKMPFGSSDAVKVTHGTDAASRTAWIQADIDLKTDTAVIFSIGPMALQIVTPRFTSKVRAQAGANGQVSKEATGAITGDWQLLIGGSPMITLRNTGLTFDKNGKLHVDVSPDRVQLSQSLAFIQEIIAAYSSPDSGFGIYPSLTGIETRLSLPIPNISVGTTGITNLTFNFLFGLSWANDFNLYAGFGLASPNAPFNLSVFILGGGGHLVATALYHPGGSLTCQVDMALDVSAALAISLGPISGSVHINLGMRFIFNSGQGDLSLGIFLLIGGEVSILSIVSAQVMLKLEATYSGGVFTCRGIFSISIKICWCFTLEVHEEVHCSLGSGGGIAYLDEPLPMLRHSKPSSMAPLVLDSRSISTVPPQTTLDTYPQLAANYLSLID